MKKKFKIIALNNADIKTGNISNIIAEIDTANKRIRATTRYPIISLEV